MTRPVEDVVTDLTHAALLGDQREVIRLRNELMIRPKRDCLIAVGTLASAVGVDLRLEPGESFYRVKVNVVGPDGEVRQGSADDLPPAVRVFAQIVVAIRNRDDALARDLFLGYSAEHSARAWQVIRAGLLMLTEQFWTGTGAFAPGVGR